MKKKVKTTIALLLSALMLAGTVGMPFGAESADAAGFAGQEVFAADAEGAAAAKDASGFEMVKDTAASGDASGCEAAEGAEDADGSERDVTYAWYRCTAPEYLNVRTNKSTLDSGNIRGHILANTVVWAWDQGDGWHKVNFCGNAFYVSSAFLSPT